MLTDLEQLYKIFTANFCMVILIRSNKSQDTKLWNLDGDIRGMKITFALTRAHTICSTEIKDLAAVF